MATRRKKPAKGKTRTATRKAPTKTRRKAAAKKPAAKKKAAKKAPAKREASAKKAAPVVEMSTAGMVGTEVTVARALPHLPVLSGLLVEINATSILVATSMRGRLSPTLVPWTTIDNIKGSPMDAANVPAEEPEDVDEEEEEDVDEEEEEDDEEEEEDDEEEDEEDDEEEDDDDDDFDDD